MIITEQARIIAEREEKGLALAKLVAKYAGGQGTPAIPEDQLDKVAVIAIDVEEISGKENVDPGTEKAF